MKKLPVYIVCMLTLMMSLDSFGQSTTNEDTKAYEAYISAQNKLYNICHSGKHFRTKQTETFNEIRSFASRFPASTSNLYLIAGAVNLGLSQIDSLIGMLDTSLQHAPYRSNVNVTRNRIALTETGKPFPAFAFTDSTGAKTSVENFKGKYVLIDFWSSWCVPCRQEIPALKKLYKKYGGKQLEILGISMDSNKAAWLKAIAQDNQTWPQFCELAGFARDKAARHFNIYAIPANFLLDKDGIIVGQDLSPGQVADILADR